MSGEPGVGKTYQSMQWEEPVLYLDLERRGGLTKNQFPDNLIDLKNIKQFGADYKNDYYASYLELCKELNEFIKLPKKDLPSTLVIDGISDIRNSYALANWQHTTGKTKPGEYTWGIINDMVRDLLTPLINRGNMDDFHLIFTAQFKDKYTTVAMSDDQGRPIRKSVKSGRKPATENWQDFGVNVLVELSTHKKKYFTKITKSPTGIDEFEITGLPLFDELMERGL